MTSRTLADVQADLSLVLQRKTCDMVWVGRLLNEAKSLVEHGEWLGWLRRYTALSARSAQNYMKAAAFADAIADKSETVSHLHLHFLSPRALYLLASGKYSTKIVERVLDAARAAQRHINESDVKEIARVGANAAILRGIEADQKAESEAARLLSLAKADGFETVDAWEVARDADRVAARQAQEAKAERERAEAEAILDGGPPDLPPASEPVLASPAASHVATFERAVRMLREIETKPLRTFATANVSRDVLRQIARFLDAVANIAAEEPPAPETVAAE
jgi:hypothetical protein